MSERKRDKREPARMAAGDFLAAVPHRNEAMELSRRPDGTALVRVPMRRPKWLVPPLSWIVPYSSHRRVELDAVGVSVLDLCDGRRTVEEVTETFASRNALSFREAQLAVGQFLRQLTERGILAIVGRPGRKDTRSE